MAAPPPPPKLGQNFLADTNLLEAIVRESGVGQGDVVLEIGAGEGVLTRRLAGAAGHVHAIELDRRLEGALEAVGGEPNVEVHWGDALRLDLGALHPAPTALVSNLPYAVATPVILRTVAELPSLRDWTVMVQREIADRLRADSGSRTYGSASVLVQLAAEVRLARTVDPAVFKPRPRVASAVLRMSRRGPGADEATRRLVRQAFAHRRKSLARSLELAEPGRIEMVRAALEEMGLPADARAETLTPAQFEALAKAL
jgi:16S rRNA (adenine1518-N6/adenine1519-N6)-dimethyltransferase